MDWLATSEFKLHERHFVQFSLMITRWSFSKILCLENFQIYGRYSNMLLHLVKINVHVCLYISGRKHRGCCIKYISWSCENAVMISDVNHEFFVVCKQKPLCKVPSLEVGILLAFAAYYIFNLEYPKEIWGLMTFLQDYILQVTDNLKRSTSYLSISTDINNYASWLIYYFTQTVDSKI